MAVGQILIDFPIRSSFLPSSNSSTRFTEEINIQPMHGFGDQAHSNLCKVKQ